jgi:hypothetical protein
MTNGHTTTVPPANDTSPSTSCCGGPAPAGAGACCAQDADLKSRGGTGCGCTGSTSAKPAETACC